jgi:uncharacterized protein YuzE
MKNFDFDYDSENDSLFLYLKDEKSAGGIELGNFILDFNKKGNLIAMQILNASKVLSRLLSKFIEITKIKAIEVEIINFRNIEAIKFRISIDKEIETINILIPNIKERSPVLTH